MKVEIYSDIACPWCYIGKARFDRALKTFEGSDRLEVAFRPYQLDPGAPTRAVPMFEYLERRFGTGARAMTERVAENAREEGLVMDFERGLTVNTFEAHRLLWYAGEEYGPEVQRTTADRLFEAHFAGGENVADLDLLVTTAADSGMDADRVREFLGSGAGAEEVRAEIATAQRLGISAVPTFVFQGKYAVQGAQPTSAFLEALETVAREEAGAGESPGKPSA